MTSVKNPYDTLYENLKDRFTVVYEGCDCTLGDYMLIKAGKQQEAESSLPAPVAETKQPALTAIVEYVTTQLTVKNAPKKDKTIRRFPLRSSMSAVFTAVATCALVFSFGIFALRGAGVLAPYTADSSVVEIAPEADESIEDEVNRS